MSMDRAKLAEELTTDEDRRLALYYDSRGIPSIGVGHNLRDRGISNAVCDLMLNEDIDVAIAELDAHAPWWRDLPDGADRVMVNLSFNMGWPRLAGFVHFLAAMQAHDWQRAALELQSSVWWRQVGERGPRMVARLPRVSS